MRTETKNEMRVLIADNGYLTQNKDAEIDNRIFVKQKMMLPNETEADYKEVAEIPTQPEQPQQPTIEQRVSEIEQVTTDVITVLNDKGIIV